MIESFNRSLKVKAEKFIEETWIELAVKDLEAKLSDCLPSNEVINNLEETVKSLGLSEYDLAIMIVDVGFNELEERAERFKLSLKQISAGSNIKSVLEAAALTMATQRLERCDRLLGEVWKSGSLRGAKVAPRYGTIGAAMSKHMGKFLTK